MNNQLLDIEPRDLKFIFELKKQSSCSVRVVNKTDYLVAYKVKTTSPRKYCVRPNVGIVKPKSSCDFTVTMQGQKVAPPDLICKDKFLVQSAIVPDGTTDEDITSSMFVKDDGKHVEDSKLKVILVSPSNSPELSPKKGVRDQMPAHEATLQEDHVFNGIDIINLPKEKNHEDIINLHKSDVIEKITSPNQTNTGVIDILKDVTIQNFKDSEDINVSQKEIIEDINLQNHSTSEEMNSRKNDSIGDISMQKDITNNEITPSTKHDSEDEGLLKHRASAQKERTIAGIIPPTENNTENIIPDSKAESIATESVQKNSVVGSVAAEFGMKEAEFGMKKDIPDLELVKDIETIKSKLSGLESKLREAEITISKLTEERRLRSEEKEILRKEVVALKSRTFASKRVQVGFPFLYVVVVAFIGMVLGYRFHC
ncbi:membrane trafficking regulatory protein [Lithospermum erythrorhizon]|uniref:Membrane trafficking regulatory protein n=1 Tax=Lithospermum erythrorhizon TaxID=34254 RepID=A0AAV3NVK7_LITER